MRCLARLSPEGTAGTSMGLSQTFFFLFWIYEEEPWQLYVVLYVVLRRVWTFPVASELLETYLCCVHLG